MRALGGHGPEPAEIDSQPILPQRLKATYCTHRSPLVRLHLERISATLKNFWCLKLHQAVGQLHLTQSLQAKLLVWPRIDVTSTSGLDHARIVEVRANAESAKITFDGMQRRATSGRCNLSDG